VFICTFWQGKYIFFLGICITKHCCNSS